MPRRRLRTFTLWTGTVLCVLIAAAFVVSGWCWAWIQVPYGPAMFLVGGSVGFHTEPLSVPVSAGSYGWGLLRWNTWASESGLFIQFPIYAVFAAVAVPTLLVWRFGRKPVKPGHCRCGYNLTGLTEARCPECGMGFGGVHER